MAQDRPPKSAYELAMERLEAEDRSRGDAPQRALTAKQKRQIGELRDKARAKLAELEILHRKEVAAAAGDPEQLTQIEQRYRIDRERVESRTESDVARIKRGEN